MWVENDIAVVESAADAILSKKRKRPPKNVIELVLAF